MTGKTSYLAGQAAEDIVARFYAGAGLREVARRWRGKSGEIDLVFADGGEGFVFVEVKASATHARAAHALRPAQISRLLSAAQEFVATAPAGQLSPMRFDVALVDRTGRVDIIENAIGA